MDQAARRAVPDTSDPGAWLRLASDDSPHTGSAIDPKIVERFAGWGIRIGRDAKTGLNETDQLVVNRPNPPQVVLEWLS